jgi:catechol 2,3-dioxygenase-like lactoylglutathione lyase family enzyme
LSQLRFSHIGICVSDWQRSLCFYRDRLGFRQLFELELAGEPSSTLLRIDDVEFRAIYLERDGVRIELLHFTRPGHTSAPTPRPVNQLGLTHLSLQVRDLDAFSEELAAAGVELLEATRIDVASAGAKAMFIADPDGTLIELVQQRGD